MQILRKILRKIGETTYFAATMFGNTVVNKIPSRMLRRLYYRMLGAKLTAKSVIYRRVDVLKPSGLKMGKGSSIGWFCLADARGGIEIGDNVTVASYSKLVTGKHDIDNPLFPGRFEPIVIKDYAWVCTGSLIVSGVTIGKGAVVAAGAVVTKDVPDMAVVAGVPAKIVRYRQAMPEFEDNMRWSWLH